MLNNLKLVKIDTKYCDYLREYDNKVSYNAGSKELRPFVGVLFAIDNFMYFAPLSSPKPKHLVMKNSLDFFKIDDGKLGAINFNNMVPVGKDCYKIIDLHEKVKTIKEQRYQKLLQEQLSWLNAHKYQVRNKAKKLYDLYQYNKLPKNIEKRCCNFKFLEEKSKKYTVIKA